MPGPPPREDMLSVLSAVNAHPDPFVTAEELLPYLDYSTNQGVRNRLNDALAEGYIHKKTVGSNAVAYWLSDAGREYLRENK